MEKAFAYLTPEPPVEESLQSMADRIATEHGISTSTFFNLIESESNWQTDRTSPQGDRGILQINKKYHPEVTDECSFDPECAMEWAAQRIAEGYLDEWVAANCYSLVEVLTPYRLPKMAEIAPNSPPTVGSVAIFNYSGTPHLAVITAFTDDGFIVREANYKPAVIDTREISFKDKALVGFWRKIPEEQPLTLQKVAP